MAGAGGAPNGGSNADLFAARGARLKRFGGRPQAVREASENYGFGIIRFALDNGFRLQRLPDDQVEGHASYVVRVIDPTGGETTLWIDCTSFAIRKVGFDTPRGWHERIYSDFFRVEPSGFMQPGCVRLYYRGALTNDITWEKAVVNESIADEVFVLGKS